MDRLPPILYHATPPGSVQGILRRGLLRDESHVVGPDGIHLALRSAALRVAGQYIYHSTLADSLLAIAEQGLDPAYGGGNFSMEGWSEGKVFFSEDPQKALYYGENAMSRKWDFRKDPPVLLRVPAGSVETERDKYGDLYTEHVVPPNLLEAKTPEGWQPLDEEIAENARDIFGEQYLGRDRPALFAPDFSAEASAASATTAAKQGGGHRVELTANDHGGVTAFLFDADGEQVDEAYADVHMGPADDFQGEEGRYDYFNPNEPIEESGTVAVLTGLELPEDLRGRGLGREMVEAATRWALSRGAEAVYAHAVGAPGDPDPEGFYERLGFEAVDRDSTGNPYMRLGPSRTAAREPAFLKRLRDADALPSPADASAALSSVMGGTLVHQTAGSTGTPGEDLSGKIQSILDNGLDPAYWAKPWAGSPGAGHPQAVYLSLAWPAVLDDPPPSYVLVEPRLSRPLVLRAGDSDGGYTWGPALNEATGKSGKGLSSFLRARGYDSVITVHKYGVGEVAYFGEEPLPAFLPEPDRTARTLGAAAEAVGRAAAVGDIYRGVKTVVEKYGGKGLFARFSDVPKIGIRPSTEHHDPYGVYFYPVDWLAENAGFGTTYINLPYITVAKVRRSGWLNLATIRPAKARELAEKGGVLEEYEARTEGKGLNQAKGGRAGKRLWDAVEAKVKPFESDANKMEWNRIFGRMGVKAIYDPGTGSVNSAEPSQIVVLDLSLIEVVDVVDNKEDRKSVFHAVLKAVADEVLDDGWRVSGSHAEGGISADGTVGGQPVAMSVLPAKAGFEMEVTLSYHDPSGRKRRIVSRGRMPNEWEDAPADWLSEGHAKSILRSLGEADIGAGGEEDAEDMLDAALRALTDLRLPDLTVEEGEGGAKFWKNTGDGRIEGSLKMTPGGGELELYAEDWLLFGGEDSIVIEIGPMRVSWEGDPSSASADMASELSRAVRELRVIDDAGEDKEKVDRDAAAEIVRMRTLSWMFPDDILAAAGQKYERKKTASECPHGDYRPYSCSPVGVRMPPRVTPDIHDAVSTLFGGACTCPRCHDPGDRVASSVEERCWTSAAAALAASGFPDMDGMCLEASVVLCERLRDEGVTAALVRRWSDDCGGHWTVRTPAGEFDPTIGWWGDSAPEGAGRGRLYEVGDGSPHAGWEEDASVDEAAAYRIAEEELGVDDLEDLYDSALETSLARGARRVAMPYLHEPKCPYCGHMGPQDPKVESWASLPDDYQELLHRHYGTDDKREISHRLMWDRTVPTYCGECGRTYLFEKPAETKVAGQFKAWHGTSSELIDGIREAGGLSNPYLAATPALAEYYAESAANHDGGEPVVLEIDIADRSRLRYDGNAMDEPVTVGVSEDDRDFEWGRAEQEHPEWVHGSSISIPPEEWEYSWRGAHSVRYEGLLPSADIGGPDWEGRLVDKPQGLQDSLESEGFFRGSDGVWRSRDEDGREASAATFGSLPETVRADITENLHDAFFAGTDVSHEILRGVLEDMDTPLHATPLPVANLAAQARTTHATSPAAVATLTETLRHVGDLDPVLVDGGSFRDGGHRVLAYEAEGRDTIPTVDIGPLLSADWEAEFGEDIPGLARPVEGTPRFVTPDELRTAAAAKYYHGTTSGALRGIEADGKLRGPVYMTSLRDNARGFAENAADAEGLPASGGVVLEINLPPEARERLLDDPEFPAGSGNFLLEGDVPLEWVPWYPDPEEISLTSALSRASVRVAAMDLTAVRKFLEAKWAERGRPSPGENCIATASFLSKLIPGKVVGGQPEGHRDLVRHGLATEDEARSGGGWRDDEGYLLPHLWVEAAGRVYDLTADQFGGDPVTVTEPGGRYVSSELSEKNAAALRAVSAETDGWMEEWAAARASDAPPKTMRLWRAEGAGRGVMGDAIPGGTYFFPRRETAELWAGDRGTVIERVVDTSGASVQDVPEGEMTRRAEGVIIRRDPDGGGEILEVVVFDDSLIRTASTGWYYHGSAPDDILDIAQWGLLARGDRDGVSVTNDPEKARSWAGLKSGGRDIEVFRIPASALPDLVPEGAAPAEPDTDFTAGRQIPPERLEIMRDGSWTPLLDVYGEFLDPVTASVEAWHGTDADFAEFDPAFTRGQLGFHFGTEGQAGDVLGEEAAPRRIVRVELDISNPLRMPDLGGWQGHSAKAEFERALGAKIPGSGSHTEIVRAVTGAGYDSVVYANRFEGEGDSYIVFDASKIRIIDSVTATLSRADRESEFGEGIPGLTRAAKRILSAAGGRPDRTAKLADLGETISYDAELYHGTSLASAASIARGGFRADQHGEISAQSVSLTRNPTAAGLFAGGRTGVLFEFDIQLPRLFVIPEFVYDAMGCYAGTGMCDEEAERRIAENADALKGIGAVPESWDPESGELPDWSEWRDSGMDEYDWLERSLPGYDGAVVPGFDIDHPSAEAEIAVFHAAARRLRDSVSAITVGGTEYWRGGGEGESLEDGWSALVGIEPDEDDRRGSTATAALSKAARALGEHLGDTVTAYRALGAERAEKVMREGFAGEHHRHGVYYTSNWERAAFYARFMPRGRWGVIFELEVDSSRSIADVNDLMREQSEETYEAVRRTAGGMLDILFGLGTPPPGLSDDLEAWLGAHLVSEGYHESPEQQSVWQFVADETQGTDGEMTIAEARAALPPGRYGEFAVLDSRGVPGVDAAELPGPAQARSVSEIPAPRLKSVWLPTAMLEAAGESPPAGAETRPDAIDVIPAQAQDADMPNFMGGDSDLMDAIRKQRDDARERADEPDPEGDAPGQGLMPWGEERPLWGKAKDAEEVADFLDRMLGHIGEGDSVMDGHVYTRLTEWMSGRGGPLTPGDLEREDGHVKYELPGGRLRATKIIRKALAAEAGGKVKAAALASALRRAAEQWSEESDVDPDNFVDEGFVEDESGHAFWGSQGSGCLFVRNHPEDGRQLLLVKRSPSVEEPNTWGTTGGAVPKGESNLFASAVRETREEIGSIPPYKAVRQYVWKAPGGTFTYTTFILECTDTDWLPTSFNWEATDARWASLEEAASYDLHFGLVPILKDLGESLFPGGADE